MKGTIQHGVNAHVLNILPPTAAVSATVSDYWTMENAAHVDVIITSGTVGTASTVTVREHQSDGGTATAISFSYYNTSTSGSDTYSARTAATTTGVSLSNTSNLTYIISVDASQLSDGHDWMSVAFSTAASSLISAIAVLSGLRYGKEIPATALS